jgi:hypothetical protein
MPTKAVGNQCIVSSPRKGKQDDEASKQQSFVWEFFCFSGARIEDL